jgi:hypothetical protein
VTNNVEKQSSQTKAWGLFESVITVAFQNVFHTEMYQNDIFLFFKNYFWNHHIKTI